MLSQIEPFLRYVKQIGRREKGRSKYRTEPYKLSWLQICESKFLHTRIIQCSKFRIPTREYRNTKTKKKTFHNTRSLKYFQLPLLKDNAWITSGVISTKLWGYKINYMYLGSHRNRDNSVGYQSLTSLVV